MYSIQIYTAPKVKHRLYFCLNTFQTTVKIFYLHENSLSVVKICRNIQMKNTYDIWILLRNHGFSRLIKTSCHRKEIFLESYTIVIIYSCTQSCNENKLIHMCFLLNSRSHTEGSSMIVSLR